jgi:AcrR family transcriptional regulator
MGRREEKRDLTRQQILNAAASLFAEKGYESTTLEEVTERANVSKGTLYYNFESKEDLVVALRRQALSGTVTQVKELMNNGGEPLYLLEKLFLERAAFTEKNPELSKVFFTQRLQFFFFRDEQLAQTADTEEGKKRQFRRTIYELVCDGQKKGQIRSDIAPQEVATMLSACFLHAQGAWLGSDRSSSLVDKTHRCLHMLLDGIGAKGYRDRLKCYSPPAVESQVS